MALSRVGDLVDRRPELVYMGRSCGWIGSRTRLGRWGDEPHPGLGPQGLARSRCMIEVRHWAGASIVQTLMASKRAF